VQPWPWCTFGKLRATLTKDEFGCSCELLFSEGAAIDLEGIPTPPMYAFVRQHEGAMRLATIAASSDQDFIPNWELRSICVQLGLDIDQVFGTRH
jgi:hypothetical protein